LLSSGKKGMKRLLNLGEIKRGGGRKRDKELKAAKSASSSVVREGRPRVEGEGSKEERGNGKQTHGEDEQSLEGGEKRRNRQGGKSSEKQIWDQAFILSETLKARETNHKMKGLWQKRRGNWRTRGS